MPSVRTSRAVALITIGVTAAIFASYASSFPLAEPDEARYAEVAREMLETGDWVTPQLNYRPFLDKPPLLYWLTAAGFRSFGVSEGVARLPVMLAGLGGLFVTFLLTQAMYGPTTGAIATILLATSPLYFGMGQVLTMDMLLTLCTTVAMATFWLGFQRRDKRWYRVAHVATALGVLAKGPVAIVLTGVPALIVLVSCRRTRREIHRVFDPMGMLLATAIVVPWYVAVEVSNPGFVSSFLVHHHMQRFLVPWEHAEPLWFYAYVLPAALFPVGLLWLLDLRRIRLRSPRGWSPQTILLISWAATTLLVFSTSRSKLIPYVLPALPPLTILLARLYIGVWSADANRLIRRTSTTFAVVGITLALASLVAPAFSDHPRMPLVSPYLAALAIPLVLTAWLTRRSPRLREPAAAFCALAAGAFGMLLVVEHGRVLAKDYSRIGSVAAARSVDDVVVYGSYLPSLGFYTRKEVTVLRRDQSDELAAMWRSPSPLLLVASRGSLDVLAGIVGTDPAVLAEQNGKLLVTNEATVNVRSIVQARLRGESCREGDKQGS